MTFVDGLKGIEGGLLGWFQRETTLRNQSLFKLPMLRNIPGEKLAFPIGGEESANVYQQKCVQQIFDDLRLLRLTPSKVNTKKLSLVV